MAREQKKIIKSEPTPEAEAGVVQEGLAIDEISLLKITQLPADLASGCPNKYQNESWLAGGNAVLSDILIGTHNGAQKARAFVRAGPRATLHFRSQDVKAAIVTCGGLCPGLNNVIREIVLTLFNQYDVTNVLGVVNGYRGFGGFDPIELNPDLVSNIHHQGGTMLGTSRGGFDCEQIMEFLHKHGVNQLYIIGGDGTHRAARLVVQECKERRLNVAVACIPKTIDNDINIIDRSFGFQTAVEAAQASIRSAKVEARSNYRGIGVVKLMGRHSGLISAHATLCSGDVDLCLVPEVDIVLDGEQGILAYLDRVMDLQGHAVVVLAEGAGEELLGAKAEVDAGGNRKLPDIGPFLVSAINNHFKDKNEEVSIKFIDPSYMIRSVEANAGDSLLCLLLAQNAVHGAMAGKTGFTVGVCNNRTSYIPLEAIANRPVFLNPGGRTYNRVLCVTGQPAPASLSALYREGKGSGRRGHIKA